MAASVKRRVAGGAINSSVASCHTLPTQISQSITELQSQLHFKPEAQVSDGNCNANGDGTWSNPRRISSMQIAVNNYASNS